MHRFAIWDLALFPQNGKEDSILATASADGTVSLWKTDSSSPRPLLQWDYFGTDAGARATEARDSAAALPVPTSIIACPANLRVCAVSYSNGDVKLFSLDTGKELRRVAAHTNEGDAESRANMLVAHPTLPLVISAHDNDTVVANDIRSGLPVMSIHAHGDSVSCVDVDPSGLTLVSGGHDATVRFWDMAKSLTPGLRKSQDGADESPADSAPAVCFQEIKSHQPHAVHADNAAPFAPFSAPPTGGQPLHDASAANAYSRFQHLFASGAPSSVDSTSSTRTGPGETLGFMAGSFGTGAEPAGAFDMYPGMMASPPPDNSVTFAGAGAGGGGRNGISLYGGTWNPPNVSSMQFERPAVVSSPTGSQLPLPLGAGPIRFGGSMSNLSGDADIIPTAIVIKNIPFNIKREQLLHVIVRRAPCHLDSPQRDLGVPVPYAFNYHFDQGIFRGLAFANFHTATEANEVVAALNGLDVSGRKLRVEYKKVLQAGEKERIEKEKAMKRMQVPLSSDKDRRKEKALAGDNGVSPSGVPGVPMRVTSPGVGLNGFASTPSPASVTTDENHACDSAPGSMFFPRIPGEVAGDPLDLNDAPTLEIYSRVLLFKDDRMRDELAFSKSLSAAERRVVHLVAQKLGLYHYTIGGGDDRHVLVAKAEQPQNNTPTSLDPRDTRAPLGVDRAALRTDLRTKKSAPDIKHHPKVPVLDRDARPYDRGHLLSQSPSQRNLLAPNAGFSMRKSNGDLRGASFANERRLDVPGVGAFSGGASELRGVGNSVRSRFCKKLTTQNVFASPFDIPVMPMLTRPTSVDIERLDHYHRQQPAPSLRLPQLRAHTPQSAASSNVTTPSGAGPMSQSTGAIDAGGTGRDGLGSGIGLPVRPHPMRAVAMDLHAEHGAHWIDTNREETTGPATAVSLSKNAYRQARAACIPARGFPIADSEGPHTPTGAKPHGQARISTSTPAASSPAWAQPRSWAHATTTPSHATTMPSHGKSRRSALVTQPHAPVSVSMPQDEGPSPEASVSKRPTAAWAPDTSGPSGIERLYADAHDMRHAPLTMPVGLINQGNSCFASVVRDGCTQAHCQVLQMLVFCRPLYAFLTQLHAAVPQDLSNSTPLLEAIFRFFSEIPTDDGSGAPDVDPILPDYVYDAMRLHRRFDFFHLGHQEDAEEFLSLLLSTLHDETLLVHERAMQRVGRRGRAQAPAAPTAAPDDGDALVEAREAQRPQSPSDDQAWLEVGQRGRTSLTRSTGSTESPVTRMFDGKLRSVLTCPGSKTSIVLEPCRSLLLDIQPPHVRSVEGALLHMVAPEVVSGVWSTGRGAFVDATKQVSIDVAPPILVLHLKRFVYDEIGGVQKSCKTIDYGLTLTLDRALLSAPLRRAHPSPIQYQLFAVVYHHGRLASGGHYTMAARRQDDSGWLYMDDTHVGPIPEELVTQSEAGHEKSQAYLLFYQRV
ncbi:ubiquitinyl hydrolase 1 [Malassezia sp. CBS 17886]|nr:ubiquitinyl hydrolase 1 [Malassezia sp. CBS 17886]